LEVDGYACDQANITATCYRGDLSGVLGPLTIVASDGTVQKLDIPDPALTLHDLTGHSIVIHAADGASARIACAPIVEVSAATTPPGKDPASAPEPPAPEPAPTPKDTPDTPDTSTPTPAPAPEPTEPAPEPASKPAPEPPTEPSPEPAHLVGACNDDQVS
jgi:hypothetical protein